MPRPRKCRWVECHPTADFFAPRGVPLETLQGVVLPVEGLEALRLADERGYDHATAAAMMGVSRPTFSRILTQAHATVAGALVNGWGLRIAGGDYQVAGGGPGRHGRGGGGHGQGRRWRKVLQEEGE
ncbi:DUF134 domain-containing protein [Shumkonia mesophila]|uniref:DUF134 domain-containing protein n=1 Tax=Shumkonia mesophila TaxID=2838854 RepID=UPI002934D05B|nr:DUF134 domain-containing protein [Shumkonia mesophila]